MTLAPSALRSYTLRYVRGGRLGYSTTTIAPRLVSSTAMPSGRVPSEKRTLLPVAVGDKGS